MRKLFLLVAMLCLLSSASFAAVTTATFGDQNSSGEYRVKADSDGVVTYAADTGILYPYENYTAANTANTVTAAESGKMIVDTGGGTPGSSAACPGGSKHTLPTAVAGMEFSFSVATKCSITVDVQSADIIEYSISGTPLDAGDSIKSTGQAGDTVTLFSPSAGKWAIKAMKATWTDNGTS